MPFTPVELCTPATISSLTMETISADQMWRRIPPEEKFEILSKSHASGTSAVLFSIIVFLVISVGLREQLIFGLAIILIPLIFQRAASKRWRELKPRTIIEYLAVRSAARRFAFAGRARDLSVHQIIRGNWIEEHSESAEINGSQLTVQEKPVWLVLLGDSLVCLSESSRGAILEYGAHLRDEFEMQSVEVESSRQKKVPLREFRFWKLSSTTERISCRFTSRYPGAMLVFEHRLNQQKTAVREDNILNR